MTIKFAAARFTEQEALQFHSQGKPGKLEITPTKPLTTQRDLSLAYSPGVAVPVLAIAARSAARLRLHQQGQPGGGRLQRHGDPRARQPRRAGGQARHGRQGRALQALRRHRRHRHPGRHPRRRCRHQLRALPGPQLRRHQPGGHQGARLLHHRGEAQGAARHPRLPRRPARHRHHRRRRPPECARADGARSRRPSSSSSTAPARRASPASSCSPPWACRGRT